MKKVFIYLFVLIFLTSLVFANEISDDIDFGAEIIGDLQFNDAGQVQKGIFDFSGEQDTEIGKLINLEFSEIDVVVNNIKLTKEEGLSTFVFKEEGSTFCLKNSCFNNIQTNKGESPSIIKLDSEGNVLLAKFTTNENGGVYTLGGITFEAPANSKVYYEQGENNIPSVELEENSEVGILANYDNYPPLKGKITYKGKNYRIGDALIKGVDKNLGRVTLENSEIIKVWENTDATIEGIQHQTSTNDLYLSYEENFNPKTVLNKNYFNYGKNKISLGGKGFSSNLKENNYIFPEYATNEIEKDRLNENEPVLKFTLSGGDLEITKTSPDGAPLALGIKSSGASVIENGEWSLISDGKKMYAGKINYIGRENKIRPSSDIRIDYENSEGIVRTYDLDINSNIRNNEWSYGLFGKIISSQDNDPQVSYAEYIECFPVIKNANVKKFGSNWISERNTDILDLKVDSKLQTCADTQIELYALWGFEELKKGNKENIKFKIGNGKTLQYNSDGTYTIWTGSDIISKSYNGNFEEGFNSWITNVEAYANSGSLKDSLIPVEIDDLKPGDLLILNPDLETGYGHTKSVKEIIEIKGEKYYRFFAGSDPAIDARIYSNLYSAKDLKEIINSPPYTNKSPSVLRRWK